MSKKLTQEEFVLRSIAAHGNLYDYTFAEYYSRVSEVKITCTKHSKTFVQAGGLHMDGQTSCPDCVREKKMLARLSHRRSKVPEGFKKCSKCKKVLEFANFNPNKDGADGYHSVCKCCISVRFKVSRKIPEVAAKIKSRSKEYAKNNKDKCNVKSAERRAKRNKATLPWAKTNEWEQFYLAEIYHLAQLRSVLLGEPWHVDHIVPLKSDLVCGLHVSANLQLLTAQENLLKHNKYWPHMPEQTTPQTAQLN